MKDNSMKWLAMFLKKLIRAQTATALGATLLVAAILAGCAVGPDYKRPETQVTPEFRGPAAAGTNSLADLPWWTLFQDPVLLGLIQESLTNNYDLRQAVAVVEQARQQVTVARAPLFPQLGYSGGIARGKNQVFGSSAAGLGSTSTTPYAWGLASWEIDLWGRIRRLSQAAQAQYLATVEGERNVRLTLVSDLASAYLQVLSLRDELIIQREATNAYAETLRIFQDRLQGGVTSRLETDRAEASLARAASTIPDLQRRIVAAENALNLLVGRPPGSVAAAEKPINQQTLVAPEIPAGLPSDLLQRRPDISAAEQQLIASSALIGAAKANFFPQISLTGMFGQGSLEMDAFTGGSSRIWSIAAGVTGPIFQGGQIRAQYAASKAAYDQSVAVYEQTVLNALREVSDSLVARQKFIEVRIESEKAVLALISSVRIATERYINGRSSYFEVLEAQQQLYPTQVELNNARLAEARAIVDLYRVLGGGWNLTNAAAWTEPKAPATLP
ncbi:MAG TPA: efflux transporter outer membrane subunit [Verrucomicrobiota bacterium]|nr:RND transporter [Verrucomicrobiales bacterium]HRI16276.1 efflux transporter outer membrane subunit [Verrucomicrobiota bacterium]